MLRTSHEVLFRFLACVNQRGCPGDLTCSGVPASQFCVQNVGYICVECHLHLSKCCSAFYFCTFVKIFLVLNRQTKNQLLLLSYMGVHADSVIVRVFLCLSACV